uniref:Si:ch211-284k5.2 n=1 Tax=Scleropages formosus TaxID=113540 RepID=A0A8C9QPJ3_SCLFO
MHRTYQPLKPCTNKYLQKKWDQESYEQHRSKVREARAAVDTEGAPTPVQVQLKLKKRQLEEERLAVIERDNRILSTKLSHIACSNGLVDHRNHYPQRSLNGAKRREEFLLVTQENQAILRRIKARESEYRRQLWEEHCERAECWRDAIARYPRGIAQQVLPSHLPHIPGQRSMSETL